MESKDNFNSSHCRVMIVGAACVVFSRLTPEEIRLMLSYRKDALVLEDPETGETIFTMDIDDKGRGSINAEKAVFSNVTSADGKATITILLDPCCPDRRKLVEEKLCGPLTNLDRLEIHLLALLPDALKDHDMVRSWIKEL